MIHDISYFAFDCTIFKLSFFANLACFISSILCSNFDKLSKLFSFLPIWDKLLNKPVL